MNIERITDNIRIGYKSSNKKYKFYEIYHQKVSGHYLIMEEYEYAQHKRGKQSKVGPIPVKILEPYTNGRVLNMTCLTLLRQRIKD